MGRNAAPGVPVMALGFGANCCCNPCNICSDNKVPSYLDLAMLGWSDAYINDSDLCPGATTTTLVSELSTFNDTFRMDLVPEWSIASKTSCCVNYYYEGPYPDFLYRSGTFTYHNCSGSTLSFTSSAWQRDNTVGLCLTVYYDSSSTVYAVLSTAVLPPADNTPTEGTCPPFQIEGGGAWTLDAEWFCTGTGDSGNVLLVDPAFLYDSFVTYTNGGQPLLNIGTYSAISTPPTIIGASGPSSVIFTASSTKVRL